MLQSDDRRFDLSQLNEALAPDAPSSALVELLANVHVADLAELMLELEEDESWRVFAELDSGERAELLQLASETLREDLVERMGREELVAVVEVMPADEVVDLLALADEELAELVLRSVDFERAKGLRKLLDYAEDSAGGIMTTELVRVSADRRIGDAIKEFKNTDEQLAEDPDGTWVVDQHGRPVGYLSGHSLLTHSIHDPVAEVMAEDVFTVSADADQEEVANAMLKYGLEAIGVVDRWGVLIGAITDDDLQDVIAEEAQEDFFKLVGAGAVEQTRLPVLSRVRQRIPLQLITVVAGLVTAAILEVALGGEAGTAEGDRSALLRYLPIIIGLAGNIGIQSSTILVRAFATGEVRGDRELSVLGSEVLTGMTIGLICGGITALVAAWMEAGTSFHFEFGLAVGLAIAVAGTWAAFLGCVVPMLCRRTAIDPAIVAGPFLIAMSDISGAAIFVGVANAALEVA